MFKQIHDACLNGTLNSYWRTHEVQEYLRSCDTLARVAISNYKDLVTRQASLGLPISQHTAKPKEDAHEQYLKQYTKRLSPIGFGRGDTSKKSPSLRSKEFRDSLLAAQVRDNEVNRFEGTDTTS